MQSTDARRRRQGRAQSPAQQERSDASLALAVACAGRWIGIAPRAMPDQGDQPSEVIARSAADARSDPGWARRRVYSFAGRVTGTTASVNRTCSVPLPSSRSAASSSSRSRRTSSWAARGVTRTTTVANSERSRSARGRDGSCAAARRSPIVTSTIVLAAARTAATERERPGCAAVRDRRSAAAQPAGTGSRRPRGGAAAPPARSAPLPPAAQDGDTARSAWSRSAARARGASYGMLGLLADVTQKLVAPPADCQQSAVFYAIGVDLDRGRATAPARPERRRTRRGGRWRGTRPHRRPRARSARRGKHGPCRGHPSCAW